MFQHSLIFSILINILPSYKLQFATLYQKNSLYLEAFFILDDILQNETPHGS